MQSTVETELNSWDRRPDESNVWYSRFFTYLMLPGKRSIEEAFRKRKEDEKIKSERPTGYWYNKAKEFDWENRAAAYDDNQRKLYIANEEKRRFDARERRREMLNESLEDTFTALKTANMKGLDEENARRNFNAIRMFFEKLIELNRLEMGEPSAIQQTTTVEFTAEDLAAAQQRIETVWGGNRFGFAHKSKTNDQLIIAASETSPNLQLTISTTTLENCTQAIYSGEITRIRQDNPNNLYLHIDIPTNSETWTFIDGSTRKLGDYVTGANIVLLANYNDDVAAEWFDAIPYVITIHSEAHQDAEAFAQSFWEAIQRGLTPTQAFNEAIASKPNPSIKKYWN